MCLCYRAMALLIDKTYFDNVVMTYLKILNTYEDADISDIYLLVQCFLRPTTGHQFSSALNIIGTSFCNRHSRIVMDNERMIWWSWFEQKSLIVGSLYGKIKLFFQDSFAIFRISGAQSKYCRSESWQCHTLYGTV